MPEDEGPVETVKGADEWQFQLWDAKDPELRYLDPFHGILVEKLQES